MAANSAGPVATASASSVATPALALAAPTVGAALAGGTGPVTALPHAGVGGIHDGGSVSFLLVGSVLAALYLVVGLVLRGRHRPLEEDGITGM